MELIEYHYPFMDKVPQLPLVMTLRSGEQYRTVYSSGWRSHSQYFSAFFLPRAANEVRLGITVTRKVGKAVTRNLCKRRLREIFRKCQPKTMFGMGYDLVINAKAELATADFVLVERAFEQTLTRFRALLQKQMGEIPTEIPTGR